MSAKDKYHDIVKQALIDDGWSITDDPLRLEVGGRTVKIDLGAERIIAAEKGNKKIAVEIKSFIGLSHLTDFYNALGQFNVYTLALEETQPERVLYLAISSDIYKTFFQEILTEKAVKRYDVRLLIYDLSSKKIAGWKN